MIDAAGAIYVIGGAGDLRNGTLSPDVWVSTDGGARPEYVGGGYYGVLADLNAC